ncbi:uncharacterized protein CC84DRAFT_1181819 [Paraphaeosphaeria sporulosa]|uniref:Uncharacterized protein n=1 Tax=Paraphaeosphaeria sporulosa TaxID=1460663 RepID=A0A177BXI2_9PLEO|nr:uncharacterized protein CC84DRAFT_1181819 [Paraphaeosphaeria sporulosa]OAF99106.1 hypothetical protein CC84DRAFT_1181819 [Paraphaeosphaeria sporulosa]
MIPGTQGIRAAHPKTFFFAPFPDTQFDPHAAAARPQHTYYCGIRLRDRPRADSKYDVRAIYPASHPLCKPPTENKALAKVAELSIDDYFLKAQVPEDDGFLKPLWEKANKKKSGWEARGSDEETSPSPSIFNFQAISILLFLVLTLFGMFGSSSSSLPCPLPLTGTLNYALLCAAYTLFPPTLWVRDGVLQVSLRAGWYGR